MFFTRIILCSYQYQAFYKWQWQCYDMMVECTFEVCNGDGANVGRLGDFIEMVVIVRRIYEEIFIW